MATTQEMIDKANRIPKELSFYRAVLLEGIDPMDDDTKVAVVGPLALKAVVKHDCLDLKTLFSADCTEDLNAYHDSILDDLEALADGIFSSSSEELDSWLGVEVALRKIVTPLFAYTLLTGAKNLTHTLAPLLHLYHLTEVMDGVGQSEGNRRMTAYMDDVRDIIDDMCDTMNVLEAVFPAFTIRRIDELIDEAREALGKGPGKADSDSDSDGWKYRIH